MWNVCNRFFIKVIAADTYADPAVTYYDKLTSGETYVEEPMLDALNNPLATGMKSVAGLYTKDANDNYIRATGTNISGTTYYRLTSAGKATLATWDGANTANKGFRFGLTFDVGKNAFED